MAAAGEEKPLPAEEIQGINDEAEPHPPRRKRNDDLLHDEEFQRVVRDIVIGPDNVPGGGHALRIIRDPATAFEELLECYRKAGLLEGQVWKRCNIFKGLEGLDNLQDEVKMEETVKEEEEEATGCRGRDASPDRPDELAKKRRLDGP
ncbi:uncharacterized protein [Oryza sativa Japonica Group]|uniref:Class VI chitin synthase-like n=5 Tax=Oryza TaxID=4527 RepID=A3BLI7_ORYSJ|nr:uncharacterized protein LOC4343718 [Oryza sativa Japonica Group]KAB8106084.1 hypothetical protein EE612_040282 [Oryza sativa]EAZ40426.1 hypothetical protein OsJ_24878 [Oryza sativa Japonica Group]KAF2923602.1 hypothetical protein DAI22_07g205200 [Oryza sativa Japonica Group]BAC79818.1 class VI chitin synthase-like [Oryza sativa Japonica Group]BAD30487.1 class VI chitin synthase-like [Oryza sativa Japonica Group]|eukprot:NP_001060099.1 Os07g0580200 [Oryza sativa Japonica Group]